MSPPRLSERLQPFHVLGSTERDKDDFGVRWLLEPRRGGEQVYHRCGHTSLLTLLPTRFVRFTRV